MLKDDYPLVPIVALTATARTKVADDTLNILQISNCTKFNLGETCPLEFLFVILFVSLFVCVCVCVFVNAFFYFMYLFISLPSHLITMNIR
jgi:hypothetical protein